MTLKEMKIKAFSLIEEYYPELAELAEDEDVKNKINGVVNSIQMDLMKYRKINAQASLSIQEEDNKTIDLMKEINDCYQIETVSFDEDVEYEMLSDSIIKLPKDFVGDFTVYYYKYPKLVKIVFETEEERKDEDEDYEFEIDPILLEIMPYGIARDLLKMDMISGYGRYFAEEYDKLKGNIDPRKTTGSIYIKGGVDI